MSQKLNVPAIYLVDGLVIDLRQVATVICAKESGTDICRVILLSGVSYTVDMKYSRSLIQAVEWSRSPRSVCQPKDESVEVVDNTWTN